MNELEAKSDLTKRGGGGTNNSDHDCERRQLRIQN